MFTNTKRKTICHSTRIFNFERQVLTDSHLLPRLAQFVIISKGKQVDSVKPTASQYSFSPVSINTLSPLFSYHSHNGNHPSQLHQIVHRFSNRPCVQRICRVDFTTIHHTLPVLCPLTLVGSFSSLAFSHFPCLRQKGKKGSVLHSGTLSQTVIIALGTEATRPSERDFCAGKFSSNGNAHFNNNNLSNARSRRQANEPRRIIDGFMCFVFEKFKPEESTLKTL